MAELSARERIILAVDTSREQDAERLVGVAKEAGARFVKLGLELSSATSWRYCSELAAGEGLDWVADAKLDDIPNTVVGAVKNIKGLEHPPFGITMHTTAGKEVMRAAQETAEEIKMLGVTVLTSIKDEEGERLYRVPIQQKVVELARDAVSVGLKGVVSSPLEVGLIKGSPDTAGLFAMIPGTRSVSAEHADQARVGTPAGAIRDGADLLVIGRQITQAEDPAQAFEELVIEIQGAVNE
ncbi:orotidine 5'-phosphate decarboxylase [Candidatus Saccharibacteria bacterium RIFCSPLOWO2_01_FULL_48_13]|nr:MAG: orotidine 5'-phosphate decarboxylase [Candidatus Saccharibacteria bacterium RIFCSPHIGHO2_01_FULL_48_12]OGL35205.1 MAG: orotidine 5'-phosphate decarboxylase [Candidatus Saccharibacteria bacterium RIFCSPHIGHO2_12_FULL_48_21]OGL36750.1 MAG: orotidine 5'-phosphate decarboxylase [Candidatus Saccharibacteria bacterium RIFCSPLOWO2_01_FULL_48_13]